MMSIYNIYCLLCSPEECLRHKQYSSRKNYKTIYVHYPFLFVFYDHYHRETSSHGSLMILVSIHASIFI